MENQPVYSQNLAQRKAVGAVAYLVFLTAVIIGVGGLVVLLAQVFIEGVPWLSWDFLTNYPSRKAELAGIRAAILGTLWLMVFVGIFTIPVGVGSAIYLEEYAPKNRLTRIIEINIGNLAGVPSVVYGLLGLALFVQWLSMGRSILSAALTLGLLVLPIVILASREAIRSVPSSHRQAAFALGATKWDVVRSVVLPSAVPGILTGTILAMSRAIGEAAPIIFISALVYLTFDPTSPLDRFTVLPIQIFAWVNEPREEYRGLAAAGIIVPVGHPAGHERHSHLPPQQVPTSGRGLGCPKSRCVHKAQVRAAVSSNVSQKPVGPIPTLHGRVHGDLWPRVRRDRRHHGRPTIRWRRHQPRHRPDVRFDCRRDDIFAGPRLRRPH